MKPTVPLVELETAALDHLERAGAAVSNLYRALGNNPVLLRAWVDFAWTLRGEATTSRRLRELMILRCAQLAHNEYQWRDHHTMALDAGVSPDQIEALVRWASSSRFDDQERLLLRFTDEVVSGHATADVLAQLREQYGPDELVELTLTAAFYVMVPRVLDALRVPRSES